MKWNGGLCMKMLALEYSSPRRSVAVAEAAADSCRLLAEMSDGADGQQGALKMIGQALERAQVRREEIETIAVGLGPGSYTGIRMAIALAQGWQLARGVKLLGASSADAAARRAWTGGYRGRIAVAVDAQRGDYYLANYEVSDVGAVAQTTLRIVPRAELEATSAAGELLLMLENLPAVPGARTLFPTAADVAVVAAGAAAIGEGGSLEPIYLRAVSFVKAPAPKPLPL
jgi:tRNA threonylcarbamoyladenosine biosynthesis protein TsaB